jgi:hypothetical protein
LLDNFSKIMKFLKNLIYPTTTKPPAFVASKGKPGKATLKFYKFPPNSSLKTENLAETRRSISLTENGKIQRQSCFFDRMQQNISHSRRPIYSTRQTWTDQTPSIPSLPRKISKILYSKQPNPSLRYPGVAGP